jgi:hypothetical protein
MGLRPDIIVAFNFDRLDAEIAEDGPDRRCFYH